MKAALAGLLIGSAISVYLSMLYLYSVWLPLTAICVIVCGGVGLLFRQSFRPSAMAAGTCLVLYFSYFWLWPELVSSTASSPQSHFRAGERMKTRAQFFPDWPRAFKHFKLAADAEYPPALCAIAEFHYTGYMGVSKDINLAISNYQRAADLGDAGAVRAVEHLSSIRKRDGEQDGSGQPATRPEPR